jgi:hypothetical protein
LRGNDFQTTLSLKVFDESEIFFEENVYKKEYTLNILLLLQKVGKYAYSA